MSYFAKRRPILREQRRLAVANNNKAQLIEVDARLEELDRTEKGLESGGSKPPKPASISKRPAKDWKKLTVSELTEVAKDLEITGYSSMNKSELIRAITGDE